MDRTKTNDVEELTKLSQTTFLNISQMAHYRLRYAQAGDAEDKENIIYHTCLAGLGILGLFAFGIASLVNRE